MELDTRHDKQVTVATQGLVGALLDERAGLVSSNEARLRKGKYLTDLERIGQELDAEQIEDMTPLQWAQAMVQEELHNLGMFDVTVDDYNARTVYKALEPYGGLNAEFRDVLAVNPDSGEPVLDEDGEPFSRSVGEVPVNKLFYVRNLFEQDFQKAASFARRFTEQDLKQLNKLVSKRGLEAPEVIGHMDALAGESESVRDYVREQLGEDEGPSFKSITVREDLLDGPYGRSLDMASLIFGALGRRLDDDGRRLSNTSFLEMVLQMFDPQEFGPWHLLEIMARLDIISEDEVVAFRSLWEEHGLAERWQEHADTDEAFSFAEFYGVEDEDDTITEVEFEQTQEALSEPEPDEDDSELDIDAIIHSINSGAELPF